MVGLDLDSGNYIGKGSPGLQTPPRIKGMKYAAQNGNITTKWMAVDTPNNPTNAYPAVAEGVYG